MSFSTADVQQMLFTLGYSGYESDGPAVRSINDLNSHPEMEPIVRIILAECAEIDQAIARVKKRAVAIEDGSVKMRAFYDLQVLRSMGRQSVKRLSSYLKCAVAIDIYGAGFGGQMKGGGFYSGDPSENRIDAATGEMTFKSP